LKLSQEELADVCQLDRTYIGGVERGERNLSLVNIYRIATALAIKLYRSRAVLSTLCQSSRILGIASNALTESAESGAVAGGVYPTK
jgi:transcriptional regulator with XRE-family HTH domain